jgi:surface antigen-like variable number repeat protein
MPSRPALHAILVCAAICPFISRPSFAQSATPDSHCSEYVNLANPKDFFPLVIDDVKLEGAITLSASDRQEFVESLTHQKKCVTSDWLSEIEEVPARGFWTNRGYVKVEVKAEAETLNDRSGITHAILTLHIKEGIQYRLKEIRFRKAVDPDDTSPLASAPSFPRDQLRKLTPLEDGDLFRSDRIREELDALKHLYGRFGYIEFVATPNIDVDDEKREISLVMEMAESKQFRFSKVEVLGEPPLALRAIPSQFIEGQIVDLTVLNDATKQVQSHAGCARERSIQTRMSEKAATVEITFDFRPCPLPEH